MLFKCISIEVPLSLSHRYTYIHHSHPLIAVLLLAVFVLLDCVDFQHLVCHQIIAGIFDELITGQINFSPKFTNIRFLYTSSKCDVVLKLGVISNTYRHISSSYNQFPTWSISKNIRRTTTKSGWVCCINLCEEVRGCSWE